ncbi:hypothetical protein AGDE_00102 [Angomonas deanei]|uniref:Uncharacterized protein n=1 Tax=Angomonas deanei TaxID=59799 RepID=S9WK21_9TRYP|nr:hypothetical protein AGDE_07850 [Angomonas deanei]EPY36290.1 hypothetical protein AGDE_06987 [Angomonas deanei]EPY40170.1 hypothetical protein AGDE_03758 [Angomonas deanei]EPY43819.1 hypothetical protein AGDE_00102 [Angomonas deanei]CAD2213158.1 hypothetical protein, conserved [Angomonas deanei]|eukprot:EPY34566.1 hypothetical protein AGDE_07850 [Angomonas deanei]
MATLDSELALVKRFCAVSEKYDTRPSIARRNTMPTLVRFLDSKEREIRKYSLEAVYLLAQHPDNVFYIGDNEELVKGVVKIYQDAQYDDPELCEKANLVLDVLSPTFENGDPRKTDGRLSPSAQENSVDSSPRKTVLVDTSVGEDLDDLNANDVSCGTADSDRRSTQGGSVSALLEIPALNPRTNIKDVELVFQRTQGVLSYTVYSAQKQVKVFLNAQAQLPSLQQNLTTAGYINLVLKVERLFRPEGRGTAAPARSYYDTEQSAPTYLTTAKSFASNLYGALIAYTNPENNTLAARVQRRRQLEAQGEQTNSVTERAARAFAKWW